MIKILLPLYILLLAFPSVAQTSGYLAGDKERINYNSVAEYQSNYLFEFYSEEVGYMDKLINGRDFYPYYYRSKLKPLLFIEQKRTSSITLDGRKYTGLTLQYDTYLDEIIYTDKTKSFNNRLYQIALNKELIDGFELYFEKDSLIFRHFRTNEVLNLNLKEGFYELVYEGGSKYIIKHQSLVYERDGIDEYFYTPQNYVMVGSEFNRIRSLRGFINLFGDKSDGIKKFIRSNRIDIRDADKTQLVKVLKYYDSLITTER